MALYRSKKNRKISGCCGGLGEEMGLDPTLVRIVYFWLTFFSGIILGLIVYVLWVIFIPERKDANEGVHPYKRLYRSNKTYILGGVLGGLSEFTGVRVGMLRLLYAVVAVFTVILTLLLVYLSLWFFIPKRPHGDVEILSSEHA